MKVPMKCINCDHHFNVGIPITRDRKLECPCCHTIHRLSKATKKLSVIGVKHRKPKTPYWEKGPGFCRWCGEPVYDRYGNIATRKRWHDSCVNEYFIRSRPIYARRFIWERDKGVCASCKKQLDKRKYQWELDHIVPLIDGGSHDPENMQILCKPCHTAKTSKEASERAKKKRKK